MRGARLGGGGQVPGIQQGLWGWGRGPLGMPCRDEWYPGSSPGRVGGRRRDGRALACPQVSPRTRSASKCRLTRCGGQENDLLSVLTVTSLVPSEDAERSQSPSACKKWNSVASPLLLKKTFAAYLWNRFCIPGTALMAYGTCPYRCERAGGPFRMPTAN